MNTQELLEKAQELILTFGVQLVAAIAVFVIGRWLARILAGMVRKVMTKTHVDQMLVKFVGNLIYIGLLIFVVLAAVNQLGVQTASFIAVIGAAGLAIGLALQGSLANFAAGVLIIMFRPYKTGDYIEAAGVSGSVHGVQIMTTILTTPDNKRVVVPNSQMMGGTITNYSALETRRVDLVAGVAYDDNLDKVKHVLEDIISRDERILKNPAPTIAVLELADSSVNFAVRPWVNTPDYWPVRFALNEQIKKRFDEEGISIPFPQRDVHIYQHES